MASDTLTPSSFTHLQHKQSYWYCSLFSILPLPRQNHQRSQFTAGAFTEAVLGLSVRLPMDGKGSWRDNVFVKRVWRSIKYEEVCLKAYESVRHDRRSICEYIDLFNPNRPIRVSRIGRRMRHTSRRRLRSNRQHDHLGRPT